jgi:hypothetical protein
VPVSVGGGPGATDDAVKRANVLDLKGIGGLYDLTFKNGVTRLFHHSAPPLSLGYCAGSVRILKQMGFPVKPL